MNVTEAVERRTSIRAFKPDPVAAATVREILTIASRSPSGGNLQPWKVHAVTGPVLAEFKALIVHKLDVGETEAPEYAVYPPNLWEPLRARRGATRVERYQALGFDPNDPAGEVALTRANFAFFGAPIGLFFCRDRRAGEPQWSDLGMLMQTVMLLATERGLDTCAQEIWSRWPQTIARFLNLDAHTTIFAGMALGYRDRAHPINAIRTPRAALPEFASLRGFSD